MIFGCFWPDSAVINLTSNWTRPWVQRGTRFGTKIIRRTQNETTREPPAKLRPPSRRRRICFIGALESITFMQDIHKHYPWQLTRKWRTVFSKWHIVGSSCGHSVLSSISDTCAVHLQTRPSNEQIRRCRCRSVSQILLFFFFYRFTHFNRLKCKTFVPEAHLAKSFALTRTIQKPFCWTR